MSNKKMVSVIQENAVVILYIFFLNLLLLLPSVMSPIFKKVFADYILINGNTEWLFTLLTLMLGTALLSSGAKWLSKGCLLNLSEKIEISGISKYMWILLNSHLRLFDKKDTHLLLSRSEGSKYVSRALTGDIMNLIFNIASVVFYLLMMLKIDKAMTGMVLVLIVFNFILVRFKDFLNEKLTRKDTDAPNPYALTIHDERMSVAGLMNIETFKSTASEPFFFKRLIGSKMAIINAKREKDFEVACWPLDDVSEIIFMNLLLFFSAFRIMNRSFSIGSYLAFQAYAAAFFSPMSEILTVDDIFDKFKKSIGYLYSELGDSFEEDIQEVTTGTDKLDGNIEFNNVTFGYEKNFPVIKNFNLSVKPGQRIAILGKSGAGKSTLLKLLQGFYKPDSGEITIDGIDPARIEKRLYLNSIGSANQEISLFSASVRHNITMWDESVSEAEIYNAANDACIHGHIASLDGAYDYVLMENGNNLSGGQRQRLEIARAFLYNPSIVLFDEAMSSIDPESRRVIEDNLVKKGCTCIAVTHILAHIPEYDEIIILEDGIVIARGTHEQLLLSSLYYASLFESERVTIGK